MKKLFFALVVIFASCSKQDQCVGTQHMCVHKFGIAYTVCPDPNDPTKTVFTHAEFAFDTLTLSSCDTSFWLDQTRALDRKEMFDPNPSWAEFSRLFPNECGCE